MASWGRQSQDANLAPGSPRSPWRLAYGGQKDLAKSKKKSSEMRTDSCLAAFRLRLNLPLAHTTVIFMAEPNDSGGLRGGGDVQTATPPMCVKENQHPNVDSAK